jgi:hypothetical protein
MVGKACLDMLDVGVGRQRVVVDAVAAAAQKDAQ